jgi:YidC/Oxa1 family membrane protein insertase
MNYDNKNFILAIVLSMLIIFGWQYFYAAPLQEKLVAEQSQTVAPAQPGTGGIVPGSTAETGPLNREQALAATPRLKIETDYVSGTVNLQGGQIDDLHLLRYRETIDPKSPTITFLPAHVTPGALYAEQGFVPATGTLAKLPDSRTVWSAPQGAVLTESNPVTLTWDNGEGLVFSRKVEISDQYLFTVTQTVENRSQAPVALIPYARLQRQDTPLVSGFWVNFFSLYGAFPLFVTKQLGGDETDVANLLSVESFGVILLTVAVSGVIVYVADRYLVARGYESVSTDRVLAA